MEHSSIALPVSCCSPGDGAAGHHFNAEWFKGSLTERTLKYPLRHEQQLSRGFFISERIINRSICTLFVTFLLNSGQSMP